MKRSSTNEPLAEDNRPEQHGIDFNNASLMSKLYLTKLKVFLDIMLLLLLTKCYIDKMLLDNMCFTKCYWP